jgi:hypothetical protein
MKFHTLMISRLGFIAVPTECSHGSPVVLELLCATVLLSVHTASGDDSHQFRALMAGTNLTTVLQTNFVSYLEILQGSARLCKVTKASSVVAGKQHPPNHPRGDKLHRDAQDPMGPGDRSIPCYTGSAFQGCDSLASPNRSHVGRTMQSSWHHSTLCYYRQSPSIP